MYCSHCGSPVRESDQYCPVCGAIVQIKDSVPSSTTASADHIVSQEPGRGSIILMFGLLSISMFGPFFGIPAWVMGKRDLKKIESGKISSNEKSLTRTGMILGIIGTFVSPFTFAILGFILVLLISLFSTHRSLHTKQVSVEHLTIVAVDSREYKTSPFSKRYSGSTEGYQIPLYPAKDNKGFHRSLGGENLIIAGAFTAKSDPAIVSESFFMEKRTIPGDLLNVISKYEKKIRQN